jgi:hypothetical protein
MKIKKHHWFTLEKASETLAFWGKHGSSKNSTASMNRSAEQPRTTPLPANGVRFSHLMSYSAIRRGTSSFCRHKPNNRQQRFLENNL